MKVITLSIKQKYFDLIASGEKKQEFREIRPTNAKRYFRYLCEGKEYDDPDNLPEEGAIDLVPVKYDAIKFLTGAYNKGPRPWMLVEVKDAVIEILTDENGDDLVYEYNGEEYLVSQIVYTLGEVLEVADNT